MTNPVALDGTVYLYFGTSSASTGAATDADSTPTVNIANDGVTLGYTPTVTNVATGLYKTTIVASVGNGFAAGSRVSVYVTATVGGVTGRDGIGEFEILATDLNTGVASVTGDVDGLVGGVTGLVASNLDVAVSTRLATASYTAPDNAGIATISAMVDEIYKIHGLETGTDLIVTALSRVAGSISQTITSDGGTTTVSRP